MSFCRKDGKDVIIFATEADHKVPSTVSLAEPDPQPGLILPDGTINWNCPCLGGMATGPCGVEFRDAFSCFHYSKSDPKGSECFDNFRKMQMCMAKFPTLYNNPDNDDDYEDFNQVSPSAGMDKDKSLLDNIGGGSGGDGAEGIDSTVGSNSSNISENSVK